MLALATVLVSCQALGAVVGAVYAVWGELAYVRAMSDGKIDSAERAHLARIGTGLRFGMLLLLTASLGIVVVAYTLEANPQPALSVGYWVLITLSLITVSASWALSRNKISFAVGSAIVFTAWWFLVYLTLGIFPLLSFGATAAFFIVATGISYLMLNIARCLVAPKH